jgi:hypothetical protein
MRRVVSGMYVALLLGALGCGANRAAVPEAAVPEEFPQWWDPSCGTPSAACKATECRPSQVVVYSSLCSKPITISTGCIPKNSGSTGWGCWVRTSDRTVLESIDPPVSYYGLQSCVADGLTSQYGYFSPSCPYAGSDAAVPDAAPAAAISDGSADHNNDIPQWWDPTCGSPNAECDPTQCRPAQIVVYSYACAKPVTISTGCFPKDTITTGWGCWVRASDGAVLESTDSPVVFDGLKSCAADGLTSHYGYFSPNCPDAGPEAGGSDAAPAAVPRRAREVGG